MAAGDREYTTGFRVRLLHNGLRPAWIKKGLFWWKCVDSMDDASVFRIRADVDQFMARKLPRRDYTIYEQTERIAAMCDVKISCVAVPVGAVTKS